MAIRKKAIILYVPSGADHPEHVKVEFIDEQGRRCLSFLDLNPSDLATIKKLPNASDCTHPTTRVHVDEVSIGFWLLRKTVGYSAFCYCPSCGLRGGECKDVSVFDAALHAQEAWCLKVSLS